MTGIDSWSITPATNATADAGAINWSEGQAPSTVNNTARQMLADTRSAFNDLAWFQYGTGDQNVSTHLAVPAVYASGTSFTIAGADVTSVYHLSRRVRAVGVSTGTIYGRISISSYAPTTTTVTVVWDSGSLSNETLVISLSQIPVTGGPLPQLPRYFNGNGGGTSTASATYVMGGNGATWTITPLSTGRARVMITGTMTTSTTNSDSFCLGKYGTGTAPIGGAAVTGTSMTTSETRVTNSGASGNLTAFAYYAEITGLTINTAYWFDIAQKIIGGGTTTINALVVSIQEF